MEKAVLRKLTLLSVVAGVAVLALWGVMALRDAKRDWKQIQARYQAQLLEKIGRDRNPDLYRRVAEMKPEVKQVVVEEWKAVDRCVTCHLGIEDPLFADAKQPYRTHPFPELLKKHPVEKYGCTICHGGQGSATSFEGAAHRAIENWPNPMVRKQVMQSRCGYCHKDFQAIAADRLIKGRELFKEMHCAGCHQIERQGGMVGPDLSAFADKDPSNFSFANLQGGHSKESWVIEHFKDPKRVSPGSPMRSYAMNDYQIECLTSFVLSLNQKDFTRSYTPKLRADYEPPKVDAPVPEPEVPMLQAEVSAND